MTGHVTTLLCFESFVPDRVMSVEHVASMAGLSRYQARMFRRIRGLDQVRCDPDLDLFEMVTAPARALLDTVPDRADIRYLIFAHTFPDLTPSYINAAERIRDLLGLDGAEAFALTQQNCASGLAAIDMGGELLRADADASAKVLIVTGDKPFTGLVRFLVNASIMGEASGACLVGLDGDGARVRSYAVRTLGEYADAWRLAPEPLREFGNSYNPQLIDIMQEALDRGGFDLSDIEMVVPHNVNLSSWLRLCTKMGIPRERVFLDNVAQFSHCFCSDSFLNLASMRERQMLVKGGLYLLTAVGIGATYAAMVIEY